MAWGIATVCTDATFRASGIWSSRAARRRSSSTGAFGIATPILSRRHRRPHLIALAPDLNRRLGIGDRVWESALFWSGVCAGDGGDTNGVSGGRNVAGFARGAVVGRVQRARGRDRDVAVDKRAHRGAPRRSGGG